MYHGTGRCHLISGFIGIVLVQIHLRVYFFTFFGFLGIFFCFYWSYSCASSTFPGFIGMLCRNLSTFMGGAFQY